jgi:hypothetical protein
MYQVGWKRCFEHRHHVQTDDVDCAKGFGLLVRKRRKVQSFGRGTGCPEMLETTV